MKKRITYVLTLALAFSSVGLGACNTDTRTVITFWTRSGTASYYDNLVAAFESAYPDIRVDVEDNGDYADLHQNIMMGISQGNVPEIAITYPDYVATYLASAPQYVVDMTTFMEDSEIGFGQNDPVVEWDGEEVQVHTDADDMIQAYMEEGSSFTIDGQDYEGQYELPLSKSTEMLFVNVDELTQVAADHDMSYEEIRSMLGTWEGLWEVTDMMKESFPDKYTGQRAESNTAKAPLIYEDDTNFYITLSQQLGIPYVDSSDPENPVLFGLTEENISEVVLLMQKLGQLYNSGNFVTGDTSGQGESWYATSGFADEGGGLIITTTAGLSWLNNYGGPHFDIDVLPMPSSATYWIEDVEGTEEGTVTHPALDSDADPDAVISQGPGVVFFDTGDEEKLEAAWLFYKTITSDFLNAQWVAAGTYAPVRQSVYETDVFQSMFDLPEEGSDNYEYNMKIIPAKEQMYEVIDSYDANDSLFTTDVFPGSGDVRTAAGYILPGCVLMADNQDEAAIRSIINDYFGRALAALN